MRAGIFVPALDQQPLWLVPAAGPLEGEAAVEFIVEAEDMRHLNKMVLGLRRVAGVRAVQRTQKI